MCQCSPCENTFCRVVLPCGEAGSHSALFGRAVTTARGNCSCLDVSVGAEVPAGLCLSRISDSSPVLQQIEDGYFSTYRLCTCPQDEGIWLNLLRGSCKVCKEKGAGGELMKYSRNGIPYGQVSADLLRHHPLLSSPVSSLNPCFFLPACLL